MADHRRPFVLSLGSSGLWASPEAAGLIADLIAERFRVQGKTLTAGTALAAIHTAAAETRRVAALPADVGQARPLEDEIDAAEAARILGVGRHQVTNLARTTDRLDPTRKVGRSWRLSRARVEEFAAYRREQLDDQHARRFGGRSDIR